MTFKMLFAFILHSKVNSMYEAVYRRPLTKQAQVQ